MLSEGGLCLARQDEGSRQAALSAYLERPEWKWTEEELDEMQDLTEAE